METSSKINQNLQQRKKTPIFNLQFTETFDNNPNNEDPNEVSDQNSDEEEETLSLKVNDVLCQ